MTEKIYYDITTYSLVTRFLKGKILISKECIEVGVSCLPDYMVGRSVPMAPCDPRELCRCLGLLLPLRRTMQLRARIFRRKTVRLRKNVSFD